jgi:hypothetical protein
VKALSQFLFAGQTFVGSPVASLDLRFEDVLELMVERNREVLVENAD